LAFGSGEMSMKRVHGSRGVFVVTGDSIPDERDESSGIMASRWRRLAVDCGPGLHIELATERR
jgi:hypothetical protein